MQFRLFLPVIFALSGVLGVSHASFERSHWYETRSDALNLPQSQQSTPSLVIDTFQSPTYNDLGFWHGTGENLTTHYEPGLIHLFPTDPDHNFHTQFGAQGCFSLLPWQGHFLHVVFQGTDQFSVSINEHNAGCNPRYSPFPGVSDSVQASRYVMRTKSQSNPQSPASLDLAELFIPLSHFRIDHNRVLSISFSGFYTSQPLTLHRVEFVPTVPPPSQSNGYFQIPEKLNTGTFVLRCSRPNSFAFGIDDGDPMYAQEVMRILDAEDVRVTFFVVGAGLRDSSTNFTRFYREMLRKGHQVAFHSNSHPKYVSSLRQQWSDFQREN